MDVILEETESMIELLIELKLRYNSIIEQVDRKDKVYFNQNKDQIDHSIQFIEAWSDLAIDWVKETQTSLKEAQIISTKDNLILLVFNSYYKDIKEKPYKNLYNSCYYVIKQLKDELHE